MKSKIARRPPGYHTCLACDRVKEPGQRAWDCDCQPRAVLVQKIRECAKKGCPTCGYALDHNGKLPE